MATELAQKPVNFFEDNKNSLFAPKEDVAMNAVPTLNKVSLSSDFGKATGADNNNTPAVSAVVAGPQMKGTMALVEAAYTAELTLRNPESPHINVSPQSALGIIGGAVGEAAVEAGGQAMKYGSEFFSKAFGLFGAGGDDNDKNLKADNDDEIKPRPAPAFPPPRKKVLAPRPPRTPKRKFMATSPSRRLRPG